MNTVHELDTTGLLCPLPVLKAAKKLRAMDVGETLELLTDDPAAVIDVPHFCNESGHTLLTSEETATGHRFVIQRS